VHTLTPLMKSGKILTGRGNNMNILQHAAGLLIIALFAILSLYGIVKSKNKIDIVLFSTLTIILIEILILLLISTIIK